ncbi:MarR family winged helix-turn-helix transcriptional regulator [Amycolatopsis azurea]|uniref:MarR family transcriptional regulator n=1 Tax=Amycolatopsis azurea DSM 43854 TaxID=1238180 RepID=M2QN76_9PSEU|nr:MarR family transcriptional regulator [Amycolatopsis azurea]EMD28141.1 Transcriptional regulator, MarR family [Amycolatopsis azurea DSM 43854]OOC01315.1 MarR family transcriptional regulator [Amycolatopsis azurea DSM 43854]
MAYNSRGDDLDLQKLFADLVRCETRLYNALNERLRSEHGMATSQFEFLRFLREHSGARVADLAAEFAIGAGATSKGVDRLERQGWIVRQINPADRRSSLLALTDEGRRRVEAAERTVTACLSELIEDTLGTRSVADALGLLRSALEQHRIGIPTG